jgi:hypothetical protein
MPRTPRKPRKTARKSAIPAAWETIRCLARELPGAEEGTYYGTPAFKVRGVLFARLHQDGESLVVKIGFDERQTRMKLDPDTFYITDHYANHPYMLVRLAAVARDDLRELLTESWRRSVPAKLPGEL